MKDRVLKQGRTLGKTDSKKPEMFNNMAKLNPPIAKRKDHQSVHHGITIEDPYNWLYDRTYPKVDDQEVLDYLKAENAYTESVMAPYKDFTEVLFQEMKGRIAEKDQGVPARDGPYFYSWRFAEGTQYKVWFRTGLDGGGEEIILDENARAKGHDYYRIGGISLSPNHKLMAWSEDNSGSERFTYRIKNLESGEIFAEEITEAIDQNLAALPSHVALVHGDTQVDRLRLLRLAGLHVPEIDQAGLALLKNHRSRAAVSDRFCR